MTNVLIRDEAPADGMSPKGCQIVCYECSPAPYGAGGMQLNYHSAMACVGCATVSLGGGGGGGVAQLVVVPLAMGRGAKSPGFDSHRGLSFQKGREDG